VTRERFSDALIRAIQRTGTCACVGIDPFMEMMPETLRVGDAPAVLRAFTERVLDAVAGLVPVVKFQAACFERFGAAGYAELERGVGLAARRGLLTILDAKRGDIGSTSDHYAAAAVNMGAHCITVNGYLGPSGIEPFLNAGLGVFVLVRTSNPDSDTLQSARLADGRSVAVAMAEMVAALGATRMGSEGFSDVGAVVGATKADDAAELRKAMPSQCLLVPGFGAQGGTVDDVMRIRCGGAAGRGGLVVNSSRAITYPKTPGDWQSGVRRAAEVFAGQMRTVA
jgi:orotidine-5'-phosphate decarboxylase